MDKYIDFINESKLQLLLEANLTYTQDFIDILNDIDTPISNEIKKLKGEEVNVKTNHIAIDFSKIDYITFIPEDKYEKLPSVIFGDSYDLSENGIAHNIKSAGYPIDHIYYPSPDEHVNIIKVFTAEELSELLGRSTPLKLTHISWTTSNGQLRETLYHTSFIRKSTENIKETAYKIGKFVNNLLKNAGVEFSAKDIEAFVDKFKAEMKKRNDVFETNFKIVKGRDIRKYYHVENYASGDGTLGSSCMRYSKCQDYLDIYVDNDAVSLIILFDDDQKYIIGRALLWTATQQSTNTEIKFMDRVYVNQSNDIELFRQFAIKNKFHYKHKQDYSDTPLMFDNNQLSTEDSYITIFNVSIGDDDLYPYVDTVKYYCESDETLTNNSNEYNDKVLDSTSGGRCSECDGEGYVECNRCEGEGQRDCYNCDGDGDEECEECGGDGEEDCNECGGDGTTNDCETCEGVGTVDGESCTDCEGTGRESCHRCDGSGKQSCHNCNDGRITCHNCDGDRRVECHSCDGDGQVPCEECNN
jgi:hypothetical protein